jgi:hypothetical protein
MWYYQTITLYMEHVLVDCECEFRGVYRAVEIEYGCM